MFAGTALKADLTTALEELEIECTVADDLERAIGTLNAIAKKLLEGSKPGATIDSRVFSIKNNKGGFHRQVGKYTAGLWCVHDWHCVACCHCVTCNCCLCVLG